MRVTRRSFTFAAITAVTGVVILPAAAEAARQEIVRFRLPKWKSSHFKKAKDAESHYSIMKSIGCDVKKHAHGDHIDVSYRCPKWRQLNLKSHSEAHKWEKWLKYYGFETQHKH